MMTEKRLAEMKYYSDNGFPHPVFLPNGGPTPTISFAQGCLKECLEEIERLKNQIENDYRDERDGG